MSEPRAGTNDHVSRNVPWELVMRRGEAFHVKASTEFDNRIGQFTYRLEKRAIEAARQDRSETVSTEHVAQAYDALVAPARRRRHLEVLSAGFFGAFAAGLVAFFLSVPLIEEPLATTQLWVLLSLIGGTVLSGILLAYNLR